MFLALHKAGAALRLNGLPRRVQISLATYNRARPWTERTSNNSDAGGGGSRTNNVRAKITNYLRQMEVSHKVKCFPRKLISGVMRRRRPTSKRVRGGTADQARRAHQRAGHPQRRRPRCQRLTQAFSHFDFKAPARFAACWGFAFRKARN
jgi:hypothetical protein